jgi:hypothetical protein
MKKISLITILALAICSTNNVQAQGFLGRLAKKLENAKSGQSSSNESSSKKSDLTILGRYNSLSIRCYGTYDVAPIFEVELYDESRTNSDGTFDLFLMTKYTENGRTGSGEIFRKELTKDQTYFDNNGNEKFLMKIDDKTLVVVQLERKPWDKLSIKDAVMIEVWSKDKSVLERIKAKGTPYKFTEDAVLTSYVQKALDINKNKESAKDVELLAAHEQSFKYAELPEVSKLQPATVKKALPEVVKKTMAKWHPYDEVLYYYIGNAKNFGTFDDWTIVKEPRRNNVGLDKIITKRCISAIVVSKNVRGEYNYNVLNVYEDVVVGVMDGSKFTGQYYTTSSPAKYGIAKANAMGNKGK